MYSGRSPPAQHVHHRDEDHRWWGEQSGGYDATAAQLPQEQEGSEPTAVQGEVLPASLPRHSSAHPHFLVDYPLQFSMQLGEIGISRRPRLDTLTRNSWRMRAAGPFVITRIRLPTRMASVMSWVM